MVDITVRDGQIVVEPRGWSRLWTLRTRLRFPCTAVRTVRRAPADVRREGPTGWRLPGTHVPGLITAGTYVRDGEREFWDVTRGEARTVEIQLSGTTYNRLVVDVADPEATVRRLRSVATALS